VSQGGLALDGRLYDGDEVFTSLHLGSLSGWGAGGN
jgi:hypothetical protein